MEIFETAPLAGGPSLGLHGGAGGRVHELSVGGRAPYEQGLLAAYRAGWQVLVVAHNSPMVFSARGTGPEPELTT